jgi:hypothetical protein
MKKRIAAARVVPAALAVLAGCASVLPRPVAGETVLLRLSPAAAGRSLALAQALDVEAAGQRHTVQALLEVDAASVRLVLLQFGQPIARLAWDGRALQQQRAQVLPAQISAERILSDLQLVQWPAAAIAQALPAGWQLREHDEAGVAQRELMQGDALVARVRYPSAGLAELQQLRDGYRLRIESKPLDGQ